MHQLPTDQLVLLLVQTSLVVALIIRLLLAGLYRIYPYFFSYLVAELLSTSVVAVPYRSKAYPVFWVIAEAIAVCFYVLIVGELYRLVLRQLPGIASVSRRYITLTVGIAIAISLLLLFLEETPANYVSTFFVVERAVVFSLVLFILL